MKGVHFLHAAEHQSFYKLRLLFSMEVTRFYGGPAILLLLVSLHSQNCYLFPCTARLEIFCLNTAMQSLNRNYVGRGSLCICSKLMFSERTRVYCSNHPRAIKQARKSLHQALIQIISLKVLQQSTTIPQLKVYISYAVRKLVGHPP